MKAQPFIMENKAANQPGEGIKTIRKGRAVGTLLGGNLSVLTSMLGSDYLPSWEHSILFLEDVGEDIYRIDRMLTQLSLNGVFNKINGFIFGKCTDCSVSKGRHFTLGQILRQHIEAYKIPAFYGANIGHIDNIFTLPIGSKAQMDASKGTIYIPEPPVKS
jgi:muramoyltetrapeptide carboxypeptidase